MRLTTLVLCAALAACDDGVRASDDQAAMVIHATPITLRTSELNGLVLRGALELYADHEGFGGFSGLEIAQGQLVAVSDTGWWLHADLPDLPESIDFPTASFVAMRDDDGARLEKQGGDAEGLAQRPDGFAVSFERDHRIMTAPHSGAFDKLITDRRFEQFGTNKGMEALTLVANGNMLAIGEDQDDGFFSMLLIAADGTVRSATLPALSRHNVTGADLGPDGRLYLLLRDYTPLLGVSVMIQRYALKDGGFPDPDSAELLARFESDTGIDNMEGISVWQDTNSKTRVTLISDDNYRSFQRTILVDLELADESPNLKSAE